ncbi:MAG TPA: NAD/NADP octopine/nopaline dehydrogenase family protein [Methylomirabilota bacterium]|jgi:opine dehydrogenase
MRVAVLGGGNGAYATAADLSLGGHTVRLWRRADDELAAVRGAGITLVVDGRDMQARLDRVTGDIGEALEGAEFVIAAVPATAHEDLGARLAKRITEKQVLLLTPGTLGAYVVTREIVRAGGVPPLAVAETGTLPYLARKTGPAAVTAPVRAANLPAGVFPAQRTAATLARVRELFPAVRPCVDALDVALTNAGPVIHPPLVLLNAGAIDGGRFDVHAAGTTPSVRRLIEAVDAERVSARDGLRYPPPHYELATYYEEARAAEGLYGAGARARLTASGLWNETLTFDHRYVTEDVVLGLSFLESAGRAAGVATPAITGLLGVFGALLGRTLSGKGRALDNLGLGDFTMREIRAFFAEGWRSPLWSKVLR